MLWDFQTQRLCLRVTSLGLVALLGVCPLTELLAGSWQLNEVLMRSHLLLQLPTLAASVYAPPAVEGSYLNCFHRSIFDNLKNMSLSSQGVSTSLTVRVYFSHLLHEGVQVTTILFQIRSSVTHKDNNADIAKYIQPVCAGPPSSMDQKVHEQYKESRERKQGTQITHLFSTACCNLCSFSAKHHLLKAVVNVTDHKLPPPLCICH